MAGGSGPPLGSAVRWGGRRGGEQARRCLVAGYAGPTLGAAKGAVSNVPKPGCVGLLKGAATISSLLDQQIKAQGDSEVEEEENGIGIGL